MFWLYSPLSRTRTRRHFPFVSGLLFVCGRSNIKLPKITVNEDLIMNSYIFYHNKFKFNIENRLYWNCLHQIVFWVSPYYNQNIRFWLYSFNQNLSQKVVHICQRPVIYLTHSAITNRNLILKIDYTVRITITLGHWANEC